MAIRGDAANLVQDACAGIVCEPENPRVMMGAIKMLYEMTAKEREKMGESGHLYYAEHLSFNQGVNQFERIMMSLSERSVA